MKTQGEVDSLIRIAEILLLEFLDCSPVGFEERSVCVLHRITGLDLVSCVRVVFLAKHKIAKSN
ncbi:hypothetical protein C5Y93_04745 [Blastopirellula marina]|uniref:Uncharacterized protein n=1 Tax=Blastopirellula marina TaxID=124 RepID=A0A2S8GSE6_9BACT|nr:hypothetical protein C5Y93_04745 [Blastopirellula marina]